MNAQKFITITAFLISTSSAIAQQCENGVCRLRPVDFSGNKFQFDDRNSATYRSNDFLRIPGDRGVISTGDAACRCDGVVCDGRNCDCGPNCPKHQAADVNWRSDAVYSQPRILPATVRPSSFRAPTPQVSREQRIQKQMGIRWETDFQRAAELSRRTGRPMLIKVGADWCGHCQRMSRETFTNRAVTADVNRGFVAVDLDADRNRSLIQKMRVTSLPTILVMTPNQRIIERQEGFRSARQLSQSLIRHLQRAELQTDIRIACR